MLYIKLFTDQGMEIRVENMRYFAFFNYTQAIVNNQTVVTSHCDQTFVGTYHDKEIAAKKWGCFKGFKSKGPHDAKTILTINNAEENAKRAVEETTVFKNDMKFISALNRAQKSWVAAPHDEFEGMTFAELRRLSGGRRHSARRNALKMQAKAMRSNSSLITPPTKAPSNSMAGFTSSVTGGGGGGGGRKSTEMIHTSSEVQQLVNTVEVCDNISLLSKYGEKQTGGISTKQAKQYVFKIIIIIDKRQQSTCTTLVICVCMDY